MKINDYGLRLVVKLQYDYYDMNDSDGVKVSWLNIVRGLGIGKSWAIIKYHGNILFCFVRRARRVLEINSSPHGYHRHYLNIDDETILFDVYKCARSNGNTNVDIVQR
jgi:hypothetical protein